MCYIEASFSRFSAKFPFSHRAHAARTRTLGTHPTFNHIKASSGFGPLLPISFTFPSSAFGSFVSIHSRLCSRTNKTSRSRSAPCGPYLCLRKADAFRRAGRGRLRRWYHDKGDHFNQKEGGDWTPLMADNHLQGQQLQNKRLLLVLAYFEAVENETQLNVDDNTTMLLGKGLTFRQFDI